MPASHTPLQGADQFEDALVDPGLESASVVRRLFDYRNLGLAVGRHTRSHGMGRSTDDLETTTPREVHGSLAGPYVRVAGLFLSLLTLAFFGWVFVARHGHLPVAPVTWAIVGIYLLLAGLAWLTVSAIAKSVVVANSGVIVTERTFGGGWNRRRAIAWSGFRGPPIENPVLGTTTLLTDDSPRFIILTRAQARAILTNPECPVRDDRAKLGKRFRRLP